MDPLHGVLREADPEEVRQSLEDGTRRTYQVFARCPVCDRVYWRGAHFARLDAVVRAAVREFGTGTPGG